MLFTVRFYQRTEPGQNLDQHACRWDLHTSESLNKAKLVAKGVKRMLEILHVDEADWWIQPTPDIPLCNIWVDDEGEVAKLSILKHITNADGSRQMVEGWANKRDRFEDEDQIKMEKSSELWRFDPQQGNSSEPVIPWANSK